MILLHMPYQIMDFVVSFHSSVIFIMREKQVFHTIAIERKFDSLYILDDSFELLVRHQALVVIDPKYCDQFSLDRNKSIEDLTLSSIDTSKYSEVLRRK